MDYSGVNGAQTLPGNPRPHLALTAGGKAHDPGTRFANRPAQRNDSIEDGASERATEVAWWFAPIGKGPAQPTPPRVKRVVIDAGLGAKPLSARHRPQRLHP